MTPDPGDSELCRKTGAAITGRLPTQTHSPRASQTATRRGCPRHALKTARIRAYESHTRARDSLTIQARLDQTGSVVEHSGLARFLHDPAHVVDAAAASVDLGVALAGEQLPQ